MYFIPTTSERYYHSNPISLESLQVSKKKKRKKQRKKKGGRERGDEKKHIVSTISSKFHFSQHGYICLQNILDTEVRDIMFIPYIHFANAFHTCVTRLPIIIPPTISHHSKTLKSYKSSPVYSKYVKIQILRTFYHFDSILKTR